VSDRAYIPTVLVHRKDGSLIYITSAEYHMSPTSGTFAENYCPPLTRPEVYRRYRSVPVKTADRTASDIIEEHSRNRWDKVYEAYGGSRVGGKRSARMTHFRLEEI
jgi:hypothetical protein